MAAEERIALVTGASRGIGRAAAIALAASGAHVVAVARTVGALEELDDEIRANGGAATLVPLDLKDGAAIDRLGGALYERFGRIDALLGNAAVAGPITPVPHIDPRAWETAFAINVTANQRLIRSLDPLLRRSTAPRALFVTSAAAHQARPFFAVYAATKAALDELIAAYGAEVAHADVKVNMIAPGPLRTRLRAEAHPGEDPASLQPPEAVAADILRMLSPDFRETGVLFDFPSRQTRPIAAVAASIP